MLKKYLSWLTVAACVAAAQASLTACNDDEPPAVAPKAELKAGAVTASTLSFTITPSDAQEVAYVVVKKGETVPEAAAILKSGTKGQADAAKEYTATGLDAETAYVVAAAAMNGNVYSPVAQIEMSTDDAPAVTVTPGRVSSTTISFTITPSDAQEVAYVVIKKGETVPEAADILKSGTNGQADAPKEYTVTGLALNTAYVIAAAAVNGNVYSAVAATEMTTWQYDEEIEATNAMVAGYFGNDNHLGMQTGQFVLGIDDIPWDADGYAIGAGTRHQFCFYSDLASDPDNAAPADGAYAFDTTDAGEKGTIGANDFTWWGKTDDNGDEIGNGGYLEARMTLTRSGENYEIVMTGKTDAGTTFQITYNGPITFRNESMPLPTDKDLNATVAEATYYGVRTQNPDSDKWTVAMFDKKPGSQMALHLEFYSTVAPNPVEPSIPAGIFAPNDGTATTAGTFIPGNTSDGFDSGTLLYAREDGSLRPYYCTGGEFTISRSGDNYVITCNFTTLQNTKVTASFTGTFEIQNYYQPLLPDELVVDLDRVYKGTGLYYGDMGNGSYNYFFRLADCDLTEGDSPAPVDGGPGTHVRFDLYSATEADPGNILIPEGTYTLSEDNTAGTFSPYLTFGEHWFENGLVTTVTFASGTVTVSRADAVYTVKLDAVTEQDTKFTADYTGEIPMRVPGEGVAPRPDGLRGKPLYSRSATVTPQVSRPTPPRQGRSPLTAPDDSDRFRATKYTR